MIFTLPTAGVVADSAPAPAPALAPASDGGLLVNVADDLVFSGPIETTAVPAGPLGLTPGAEEGFMKFLLKNNGVLFENDILQIGVKSEYKKNLGTYIHACVCVCVVCLHCASVMLIGSNLMHLQVQNLVAKYVMRDNH